MQSRYYKEHSRYLNRGMEFKVFGHAGVPVLAFPCEGGRFFDWENCGMCEAAAPWIEQGKLQIVCVDGVDAESWMATGEERPRIEVQERWFNYVCEELLPRVLEISGEQGTDYAGKVLLAGISLGAGHAMNFYLRRPELFGGAVALSGLYNAQEYFGEYTDDLVYRNSPCDYLRGTPAGDAQKKWNAKMEKLYICCGSGEWEDKYLASAKELQQVFESKKLSPVIDLWGSDVSHDWVWWKKQWPYFLEEIFE